MSTTVQDPARERTEAERLDRTWAELLQELRVLQNGLQLLTGSLLVVAFLPVFGALGVAERAVYSVAVLVSAISLVFALVPIPLHRGLFRLRGRTTLLRVSERCLRVSLIGTGLVLTGVAFLVIDRAFGPFAGTLAAIGGFVIGNMCWLVVPLMIRRGRERLSGR